MPLNLKGSTTATCISGTIIKANVNTLGKKKMIRQTF